MENTNIYYSPDGNPEVWAEKPTGYFSVEEWQAAHPAPEPEPPTPEEKAAMELMVAQAEASAIFTARAQRQLVQAEAFAPAEFATFAKAGLFDPWAAGVAYAKGKRIVHKGVVYELQQPTTSQAHQPPDATGMLAIYRPISAEGSDADGSRAKPFAYISGMDVYTSKYYTFDGKLYLAKADMKPCTWNPGTAGLWQWKLVV